MLKKILCVTAFGALFLVPFVPLIVSSSMFFPFITGKAFAFRILTEIALAAWLGLAVLDASYRPKRSLVLIALGVFVLVVGLADAFGVNALRSFWSNYERMEGFITILHLAGYALALGSLLQKEKQWLYLWYTSIGVSIVVSFNALAQLNSGTIPVHATLGNPTYLAVYLLFHIFIVLWLFYRHRTNKWWVLGSSATIVLELIILYYTGTRGTMLGLLGGIVVTALFVLLFGKEHRTVRKLATAGLVVVVLVAGLFFAFRKTAVVQESLILSRFANISLSGGTAESRITLWTSIARPAIAERPLLGWGQDNFIIVFGKYYDPVMYKQEPWFDRAHSVFVDWLVAGGVLGLLAYLFLFGAGLWMLWKSSFSVPEKGLLAGLFVGYAIHNFFVFDNLVSYIFFFMTLAWLHSVYAYQNDIDVRVIGRVDEPLGERVIAGAILVVALAGAWALNVNGIARAQAFLDAIRADQAEQNYTKAFTIYSNLIPSAWLGTYEMREQLAQMTVRAHALAPGAGILPALTDYAEAQLLESVAEDPLNTRHLAFLGYMNLALKEYEDARMYTEEALAINPTRQIFLNDLGEIYIGLKKPDEAVGAFKRAYDADMTNTEALARYAGMLMQTGRMNEAEQVLREYGGGAGAPLAVWATAYKAGMAWEKLRTLYQTIIDDGNAPADAYVSLSYVLLKQGNRAGSVAALEKVLELFPSDYDGQIEEMISAIEAGKTPSTW